MGKPSQRIKVQIPKPSPDGSTPNKADQPVKKEQGAKKRGPLDETSIAKRTKLSHNDEFINIFMFISMLKPHILAQPALPVLPFEGPPEVPRWDDMASPTTKVGFSKRYGPTHGDGAVVCNAYMEVYMRARPNQKECYDLVDAGGRAIKAEEVHLDPGARSRIELLKIAKQLYEHYLATLESEWADFRRQMDKYRQQRMSWEHKLLKFIVTNHPDCMVNEMTDTELNELEMEITKPERKDAFYMGSMTPLHQIPSQHKEGSTEAITKRITELKNAIKRLDSLIKAEEGSMEDEAWIGSDSEEETHVTRLPTITTTGFPRPTISLLYYNWVIERYANCITKEGRPKEPDQIAKYSSTFEISTTEDIQTKDPSNWRTGTLSLSPMVRGPRSMGILHIIHGDSPRQSSLIPSRTVRVLSLTPSTNLISGSSCAI